MAALLFILMVFILRSDLTSVSVQANVDADPATSGSKMQTFVYGHKTVDPPEIISGSHSGVDGISNSGSTSGSSGYDGGEEKEAVPSGEPKGSGQPVFDYNQMPGEAASDTWQDHSEPEVTSPVELVVESVSGDYLTTPLPGGTKTAEATYPQEQSGFESSSGSLQDSASPSTNQPDIPDQTVNSPATEASKITDPTLDSTKATSEDLATSVLPDDFGSRRSEVTAEYSSGHGTTELVEEVTSEGEGPPASTPEDQDFTSSDRLLPVSIDIVSVTRESMGIYSEAPSFTEPDASVQISSERLSSGEPTTGKSQNQTAFTTPDKSTDITVPRALATSKSDSPGIAFTSKLPSLSTQTGSTTQAQISSAKTADELETDSGKTVVEVSTEEDAGKRKFTTGEWLSEDSSFMKVGTTIAKLDSSEQQTAEGQTTLPPERLTTRYEKRSTNEEYISDFTLSDSSKFTKHTQDWSNWPSSSRTRRETGSTTVPPETILDTSELTTVDTSTSAVKATTSTNTTTATTTTTTTATSTTTSTTTTTTPTTTTTTTTTTTRPTPQYLGDACFPDEKCGAINHSSCVNGTCACLEGYLAHGNDRCLREPYNLTLQANESCVTAYWQGEFVLTQVWITSPDDKGPFGPEQTNQRRVTKCNLKAGSNINVEVRLVSGGNSISSNVTLNPSPPRLLTEASSNQTCISWSWQKGEGYVDKYVVSTGPLYQNWTDSTEWTECGLTPGQQYNLSVHAVRNSAFSTPVETSTFTYPSKPVNVTAEANKDHPTDCVDIAWSKGPGAVDSFTIERKHGEHFSYKTSVGFQQDTERFKRRLCNLKTGHSYEYAVSATVDGDNKRSDPEMVTVCTAPSPVQSLWSDTNEIDATSVMLRWNNSWDTNFDSYIIKWRAEGEQTYHQKNISKDLQYDTIRGLKPGTAYRFEIATVFCGLYSSARSHNVTTKLGALENVTVQSHETVVNISWIIPTALKNTDDFDVEVTVTLVDTGKVVELTRTKSSWHSVDTNRSGECFMVRLTVVKGSVRESPIDVFASTEEQAPEKVRDLRAKRLPDDRTSMSVTWSSPEVTNGVVQRYDVTVSGQRGLVHTNKTLECQGQCTLSCDASSGQGMAKRDAPTDTFAATDTQLTVVFHQLSPYENYEVTVVAYTSVGPGQQADLMLTDQLPAAVTSFESEAYNSTCILLRWNYPENADVSTVTNFVIEHEKVDVTMDPVQTESIINTTTTMELVCELDFWTEYKFNISAFNREGEGEVATRTQRTGEHAPEKVQNLTVSPETVPSKPRTLTVKWIEPANKYGVITNYFIDVLDNNNRSLVKRKAVTPTPGKKTYSEVVEDLAAETEYTVQIYGATRAGKGEVEESEPVTIPAGILLRPSERVSAASLPSTTDTSVTLYIPTSILCERSYGQPVHAGFIVGRSKWVASGAPTIGSRPEVFTSWKEVDHSSDKAAYFVPLTLEQKCKNRPTGSISVLVGQDGECGGIPDNSKCNGRLRPDTDYRFQAVYCTSAGCTYSAVSTVIHTNKAPVVEDDSNAAGVAAGVSVVFILLFLGSGAGAWYFIRKYKQKKGGEQVDEEQPLGPEIPRNRPVKLVDFIQHVEQLHRDSNLGFAEEYKLLKDLSHEYSTRAAELPACKPKNRYTNILPWDHSRVKLLPTDDEEGSDYINANYLPGEKHRREFIAAQGPLQATVDDFWRMVWENKVATIVMLTQCVEKGKVKCEKYWPEEGEPVFYGDLCVQVRSQSVLPDYIIRVIDITLGNHTRMVKHFHFMRWPDHGCPERPAMLLNFVSAVRAHMPHSGSGPTLVHCSAGVGRTGTFIALDQLLQQIRRQTEVDIFGLVLNMRDHRIHMVQTENQYIYIHDCLVDALTTDTDEEESEASDEEDEHIYGNC